MKYVLIYWLSTCSAGSCPLTVDHIAGLETHRACEALAQSFSDEIGDELHMRYECLPIITEVKQ